MPSLPQTTLHFLTELIKHQAKKQLGDGALNVLAEALAGYAGDSADEKLTAFLESGQHAEQLRAAFRQADLEFSGLGYDYAQMMASKPLAALDALIAKKRAVKQAAMQALLTGRVRLPGFDGEWKVYQIKDIAFQVNERNSLARDLPVLTCSKHIGFVDSLRYFINQVFSNDLSGYKIIRRGQIGYPANHVEEGSIGLQDLYDEALVSPIYVVFSVNNELVDSYFLHRQLKLETYRQKFARATSASVDRRGSLRWPEFSLIKVKLPSLDEQRAIAAVLLDMDAEIAALEARREKVRQVKQGMMQVLLTGKVRLAPSMDPVP